MGETKKPSNNLRLLWSGDHSFFNCINYKTIYIYYNIYNLSPASPTITTTISIENDAHFRAPSVPTINPTSCRTEFKRYVWFFFKISLSEGRQKKGQNSANKPHYRKHKIFQENEENLHRENPLPPSVDASFGFSLSVT